MGISLAPLIGLGMLFAMGCLVSICANDDDPAAPTRAADAGHYAPATEVDREVTLVKSCKVWGFDGAGQSVVLDQLTAGTVLWAEARDDKSIRVRVPRTGATGWIPVGCAPN